MSDDLANAMSNVDNKSVSNDSEFKRELLCLSREQEYELEDLATKMKDVYITELRKARRNVSSDERKYLMETLNALVHTATIDVRRELQCEETAIHADTVTHSGNRKTNGKSASVWSSGLQPFFSVR